MKQWSLEELVAEIYKISQDKIKARAVHKELCSKQKKLEAIAYSMLHSFIDKPARFVNLCSRKFKLKEFYLTIKTRTTIKFDEFSLNALFKEKPHLEKCFRIRYEPNYDAIMELSREDYVALLSCRHFFIKDMSCIPSRRLDESGRQISRNTPGQSPYYKFYGKRKVRNKHIKDGVD